MRMIWMFLLVSAPVFGADGLLVLDLQHDAADEQTARLISDVIASSAEKRTDYAVTTGADLRKIADLETQKQAMGCEADTSCLAEIAGALGAKYVLYGSIGRLGDSYLVTMNVYDAGQSISIGRQTVQVHDAAELPMAIDGAVAKLLGSSKETNTDIPILFWSGATATGVGGVLAVGGFAVAGLAELALSDKDAKDKGAVKDGGLLGLIVGGAGTLLALGGVAVMMVGE